MNYFIYSDKQLNVFNRGKHVYSVSEDYANRYDYDLIVDKPDNQLRSGRSIGSQLIIKISKLLKPILIPKQVLMVWLWHRL